MRPSCAPSAHDALKGYRREWDEVAALQGDQLLHDWTSDYADGMRYLARGRKLFPSSRPAAPIKYPNNGVI